MNALTVYESRMSVENPRNHFRFEAIPVILTQAQKPGDLRELGGLGKFCKGRKRHT